MKPVVQFTQVKLSKWNNYDNVAVFKWRNEHEEKETPLEPVTQ